MQRTDIPVNISLMELTAQKLQALRPTRVLDIFEGGSNINFHEDGLFSTVTFGRIGSEDRDKRFSYIDLRTEILHPYVYKQLCLLKGMYKGIMSGKTYVTWDDKEKDFVLSDAANGETGYQYFMANWRNIVFKRTGSDIRDLRIKMIDKYKLTAATRYVLVIPAGYRDVSIEEGGRVKEGEINAFYRTLISISNTINTSVSWTSPILDTSRHSMQMAFNGLYDYLLSLLEGKGGFLQQKWGARRIFNGTRNVITSMDTSIRVLGEPNSPGVNNTVLGLYQTMKGSLPIAKHHILKGWVSQVFNTAEGNAFLVNPSSLRRETVKLTPEIVDRWTTTAGIEKVITAYQDVEIRAKPVTINDYYIGLIYRGPDKTFRIFGDIDELPESRAREDVYPITLCELLYLSGYKIWNKLPVYATRYPVTGAGSIYPSYVYVKNTVVSEMRRELGIDWQPLEEDSVAVEYPIFKDAVFIDTIIPHPSRLAGLGADFDGDTMSANIVYSEEAMAEAKHYLSTAAAYLDPKGGLTASPVVDTVERCLFNFTGD